MIFFPSREVLVQIGTLQIRWYAVLILCGSLLAYYLSNVFFRKAGYPDDMADDIYVGVMTCGILGARLWYVLFYDLKSYLADPLSIFAIWNGGLAIHGGLLGGLLFVYFYTKKKHYSLMHLVDLCLPNVLLAQAMGRWGNFANGECFGPEVDESYFSGILSFIKKGMYIDGAYRMPMFFYESVLCVLGWILIQLYRKYGRKQRGNGGFGYMAWYGAIRFWIESFRTDSLMIGNFKTAQIVSVISLIIGICGLLGLFNKYLIRKKPAVIFDLDGTLLNTEAAIVSSFEKVLGKYKPDLVLSEEDKVSFLGPTLQESFEKYAPEFDTEQLVKEYREYNREAHFTGIIQPFPHVRELLDWLKENDYPIAIASSKKRETVELGLEVTGLKDYFEIIVGVEDVQKHKPDKESLVKTCSRMGYGPDNAIYVGDSTGDVLCAQNAGLYSIAFVSNLLKDQELKDVHPNKIIYDIAEIKDILGEKHPWTSDLS